jgi:hypothetical protein
MEKTKNKELSSKQPTKGKVKSVKDKNTSANTTCYCYKGHVAGNNLLDIDTKSLSPNLLESNKDEVIEVAAHS